MSGVNGGGGGYRCICPACGHRMRIRNSAVQTPIFKTMYAECTNLGCGATYVGNLAWEYELNQSKHVRPLVQLPPAPFASRHQATLDSREKTDQLDLLDHLLDPHAQPDQERNQ